MPSQPGPGVVLRWLLSIVVTVALVESNTSPLSFGNFNFESGHALVGNTITSRTARDFVQCAFVCSSESRCFSFNFGRNPNENEFICEISDSVKEWDPQNFQSRPGFDYYTTADRLVVHPCLSNPCSNGGTCVENKGNYTCKCPLEINILPYTDDKCNVRRDLIKKSAMVKGVFGSGVQGIRYDLNYYEAERLCQLSGATLASYAQLRAAWHANFGYCSWGWLADSTVRYPMQRRAGGCGGKAVIMGSTSPRTNSSRSANAFCYKQEP